jgi:dTDP-glucose 4,6-dehydratase
LKLLVTGGAGFIGTNFIRYILFRYPDYRVVNFDKLTYAGNLENLQDVESSPQYTFIRGDVCDPEAVEQAVQQHGIEVIVNFAAESHVDRSITDHQAFLRTDIFGAYVLLETVKQQGLQRYLQISTDEVYGDYEGGGYATEAAVLRPSSPYSASKAGADLQVLAYRRTYNLPVVITRCTNNYGPYQYPEKLLSLFITNLLEGRKVPIYGDGKQIRDWLYVDDHCRAIDLVLHHGQAGEIYNVGANQYPEVTNTELVKMVLHHLGLDDRVLDYVADRKGHDRRYAVDCAKLKGLGWRPEITLEEGLARTITWYQENQAWWKKIKSGDYWEYYKKTYGND